MLILKNNGLQAYPPKSPPSWLGLFSPNYPPTIIFQDQQWNTATQSGQFLNYSNSYSFKWSSPIEASDFIFTPQFNGSLVEAVITWTKPDGNSFQMFIANPTPGSQYDVASPSVLPWVRQYINSQTGSQLSTVKPPRKWQHSSIKMVRES